MSTQIFEKIKEFWEKYEYKIVIFIGFCLISAISFEFGVLQGQKWQQKPLVIEKPADILAGQESANPVNSSPQDAIKTASTQSTDSETVAISNTGKCAFVGSKNSNKFYLPTCSYAKRVKPENLACYTSEQDAISKGKIKSDCGAK